MEIDRHGADKLSLEKHWQPQRGPPAVSLSKRVQREAAVELDVFREHRSPLDHHLGDQPRRDVGQGLAMDARIDPLAHLDHLVSRPASSGQRDQAGGGTRHADHGMRDTLEQRVRTNCGGGQRLGHLAQHLHRGVEALRLLSGLFEEERILERDRDLRPQRGGQLDVVVATEGPMALVGQHQHSLWAATRTQGHEQQVAIAKGLREQLAGFQVVEAVLDDGGLLGDEHPPDQRRGVGAKAKLVEAHLVEQPAFPHPGGRRRCDQRLESLLVEEQPAHLDVEQLRQLGGQRAQVLAQLGQVGDRGRGLEEVTQLLEVLVRPPGELQVQLDHPEVLEAPESGEDHHRQEEHGQDVGDRRWRPPARHVEKEELGQGAQGKPEAPVEPVAGGGNGMRFLHDVLFPAGRALI